MKQKNNFFKLVKIATRKYKTMSEIEWLKAINDAYYLGYEDGANNTIKIYDNHLSRKAQIRKLEDWGEQERRLNIEEFRNKRAWEMEEEDQQ